jgi:hypothetical protein
MTHGAWFVVGWFFGVLSGMPLWRRVFSRPNVIGKEHW